jgi:sugar phosphate isomerase/epimerase
MKGNAMRLGGPILNSYSDPEAWAAAVTELGYRAAFCPASLNADDAEIQAYAEAAQKIDIVIAEVGAWSNPLGPDEETRQAAIIKCKQSLALADKIGARCCVNVAGSRGVKWAGPHPDNLSEETFDMIVQVVREIIDEVQPSRTFYTLETMPWIHPDSLESYLRLIQAIDRPAFAAHFDPVNLICSPQRYFNNGALIRDCLQKLGPFLKSCHAKDIILSEKLTVHLDEVRPGLGHLDYPTFLRELNRLDPDLPIMLEHLPNQAEYQLAADHLRAVAQQENIIL